MKEDKRTKLSAILFTDIVGYSEMLQRDEQRAIADLERHNALLLPLIREYEGDLIDAIGEGFLVVFDSASNACRCAAAVQEAIHTQNGTEADPGFLVRIAVHQGEIWYDATKIYGNGVNIAARMLPLAAPGGICVSEDVFRQMRSKAGLDFRSLGRQRLKEIEEPVHLYEMLTGYENRTAVDRRSPEDHGDLIKSRIEEGRLKAREALSGKSESEGRIETRILGFVEKVMDKALDKWDGMSDDGRDKIIQGIGKEVQQSRDGQNHRHGAGKKKDETEDYKELLPVGGVATIGFGAALALYPALWWLVFPLIFVGLIPFGVGVSHLLAFRRKKEEEKRLLPRRREGDAITAAARHKGKLTVMHFAAESGLPLEDAQAVLDGMAARGYIGQVIEDSGMISYEFPEMQAQE